VSEPASPTLDDRRKQVEIDKLEAEIQEIKSRQKGFGKTLTVLTPLLSILVGALGGFFYFATVFRTVVEQKVAAREAELDLQGTELKQAQRKLQEAQDDFSREERKLLEERDGLEKAASRLEREKKKALARIQLLEDSLRKNGPSSTTKRELERLREVFSAPPPIEELSDEPPHDETPTETPAPVPVETPVPSQQERQPDDRARAATLTGLLAPFAGKDFYVGERIPQDELQAARQAAQVPDGEKAVALLVAEAAGTPHNVIVFGIDKVYYNHQRYIRGSIPYSDLPDLHFQALSNWGFDLGNGNYFNLAGSWVSPNKLVKILTALRDAEKGTS
jgi:hypothetical protein